LGIINLPRFFFFLLKISVIHSGYHIAYLLRAKADKTKSLVLLVFQEGLFARCPVNTSHAIVIEVDSAHTKLHMKNYIFLAAGISLYWRSISGLPDKRMEHCSWASGSSILSLGTLLKK